MGYVFGPGGPGGWELVRAIFSPVEGSDLEKLIFCCWNEAAAQSCWHGWLGHKCHGSHRGWGYSPHTLGSRQGAKTLDLKAKSRLMGKISAGIDQANYLVFFNSTDMGLL